MKVIVASHNPVKLRAVAGAFQAQFPDTPIEFEPVSVASGVAEQPRSDAESRQGAHQRAENAHAAHPDADYWVGLEGGLESIGGQWLASAWMVVLGPGGRRGEARTPTLPLPPEVCRLLDSGMELGAANDRVFATVNSKQEGGAFGLLTDGRMTRESVYTQALVLALVPFVNDLWRVGEVPTAE